MEAMLFVYFANILPQISEMLTYGIGGLVVITAVFLLAGGLSTADGSMQMSTFKKGLKLLIVPLLLIGLIKPFIPNRDTMYLMAGAYVGQQVLTSDIAKDTYEIISLEVKNILAEKKKEITNQVKEGVK